MSKQIVPDDIMVGFLGSGRMAQAMARGFVNSGIIRPSNIWASDTDPTMLKYIEGLGVNTTPVNSNVVQNTQIIFLCVKPQVIASLLNDIKPFITPEKLVVSIAAGIRIPYLEKLLPEGTRLVRVMPNTPALVQAGAAVLAPGHYARPSDSTLVAEIMSTVGICEIATEENLDAVTGLSGSGPAFAFAAIEAMSDGGVKMGLPRVLSTKLAAQTFMGAAKMVLETGKHPGQLKDDVCSPSGTTIVGMHALEKGAFRASLIDAVEAATKQSQFLGNN
ncbi:pyrroline-5-carboxylate reductase 1, mitochondrial-like [Argonauta hians]